MGWSSGTVLFDGALDVFLKYVPEDQRVDAVAAWYNEFVHSDWDTEDESKYYDKYLREMLYDYGE